MSYPSHVYVVPYDYYTALDAFEPLGVSASHQMREHANGRISRIVGHVPGAVGAVVGGVVGGGWGGFGGYAAGSLGNHFARRGFRGAMNRGADYINRRQGYRRF